MINQHTLRFKERQCIVGAGDVFCLFIRDDAGELAHESQAANIRSVAREILEEEGAPYFELIGDPQTHGFPDAAYWHDGESRHIVYATTNEDAAFLMLSRIDSRLHAYCDIHATDARFFCRSTMVGNPFFGLSSLVAYDSKSQVFGLAQRRLGGRCIEWITSSVSGASSVNAVTTYGTIDEAVGRFLRMSARQLIGRAEKDGRLVSIKRVDGMLCVSELRLEANV